MCGVLDDLRALGLEGDGVIEDLGVVEITVGAINIQRAVKRI